MTDDERTVEELLAAADEVAATSESLCAKLAAITAEAADGGVALTVDLHGKLIGLSFERQAMALRPDELASRIQKLGENATVAAMADGVAALAEVVDTEQLGLDDYRAREEPARRTPRPRAPRDDDDEFFTPATWRMT
jgi:uncharacterized protein YuzE